jgi:hypothetical protein
MAKKTKVATLKKRDKKKPLSYVDKQGNVRHFRRGQKKRSHAILQKAVVGKDLLKARKALKIILYVKGKSVMKVKSGLGSRRRKKRKAKATRRRARSSTRRRSARRHRRSRR